MPENRDVVNTSPIAPLGVVAATMAVMDRAVNRPPHLPGFVVLAGPSGYGKSTAAAFAANAYRCYYVEFRSAWTRKALLENILKEMGIAPARTIYDLVDQCCEQLAASRRPLIVDEATTAVDKNCVEILRDLHDGSGASILLVGEEGLPLQLKRWERVHGRVLDFCLAPPADIEDARHLRAMYCKRVEVSDDLLAHVHKLARGSVRRICVNLQLAQEEGLSRGLKIITLADWGSRNFFTGDPPARRVYSCIRHDGPLCG